MFQVQSVLVGANSVCLVAVAEPHLVRGGVWEVALCSHAIVGGLYPIRRVGSGVSFLIPIPSVLGATVY